MSILENFFPNLLLCEVLNTFIGFPKNKLKAAAKVVDTWNNTGRSSLFFHGPIVEWFPESIHEAMSSEYSGGNYDKLDIDAIRRLIWREDLNDSILDNFENEMCDKLTPVIEDCIKLFDIIADVTDCMPPYLDAEDAAEYLESYLVEEGLADEYGNVLDSPESCLESYLDDYIDICDEDDYLICAEDSSGFYDGCGVDYETRICIDNGFDPDEFIDSYDFN